MANQELTNLLSSVRKHLPENNVSAQQQALLQKIQFHIHEEGTPDPVEPDLKQSVEMLIDELEADHPLGVAAAKKLLQALNAMGI